MNQVNVLGLPGKASVSSGQKMPVAKWKRAQLAPFFLPAVVALLLVMMWPLVATVLQAFYLDGKYGFSHWSEIVGSRLFQVALWNTIKFGVISSLISVVVAYPVAYYATTLGPLARGVVIALVLLPFWTSILVKSFALIVLLGETGIVRRGLALLLGPEQTPRLVLNQTGVIIAMIHAFVPFLFFPILANLLGQDPRLRNAAYVMGAGRIRTFWSITFPLSLPGVAAGVALSFVMSLGYFITPQLMGGRSDLTLGVLVDYYTRESLDWTAAGVTSVTLLVAGLLCVVIISLVPNGAGLPRTEVR